MKKLMSKKQVKETILYSYAHIDRLEQAGTFPKRVRLGQNRVGWVVSEIEEWLQSRIDARNTDSSL